MHFGVPSGTPPSTSRNTETVEKTSVFATVQGKLTERGGFEPPVGFDPHAALAKRCYRPLSHLSGPIWSDDIYSRDVDESKADMLLKRKDRTAVLLRRLKPLTSAGADAGIPLNADDAVNADDVVNADDAGRANIALPACTVHAQETSGAGSTMPSSSIRRYRRGRVIPSSSAARALFPWHSTRARSMASRSTCSSS